MKRKSVRSLLLIPVVIACFGLLPAAQAVVPAPDGGYPGFNTAEGTNALLSRTTGVWNTALGGQALKLDSTGNSNTAVGLNALFHTNGSQNTAVGVSAHQNSTTGTGNTSVGYQALFNNSAGINNVATGFQALFANSGNFNSAFGFKAGVSNGSGSNNLYVGDIGFDNESNVISIGAISSTGTAYTKCFVGGVSGVAVTGAAVLVASDGQLGVASSSKRFKDEIKPMDKSSEAILALKPVTFRYKKEVDPEAAPQWGLVAEEVEKVNPDLISRDPDGKPFTVRYEAVNAMLLNEFLKEHKTVQEQGATIAELKKEIGTLTATLKEQASQIQKVSARLELSKPAPRTVLNNP